MTRIITMDTRIKVTAKSSNGAQFTVGRNHEADAAQFHKSADEAILYVSGVGDGGYFSGAFDLAEARQIRDAITEVILDAEQIIEDAKPKPLSAADLATLPTGTIVYDATRRYVKSDLGSFVKISGGNYAFPDGTTYSVGLLDGIVYAEEVN